MLSLLKKRPLRGPDFAQAEALTIKLSGWQLRFKNPPKTGHHPTKRPQLEHDLYDPLTNDYWQRTQIYSKFVFNNSWGLYGRPWIDGLVADIKCQIVINRQQHTYGNLLNHDDLINMLVTTHNIRSRPDVPVDEEKTREDISDYEINQRQWFEYSEFSDPLLRHTFVTALNSEILLRIFFDPSWEYPKVGPKDAGFNIAEAYTDLIKGFMNHLHISP